MNKTFLSLAVLGLIAIIGWYSFSSLKTKIESTTAPERQTQSTISTPSEDDLLSKEIQDGDRALITYGNENEKQIENQFQQVPSR